MIPPLPLGKSESSWLHQSFVARALADASPNTLLGEAPPPVNPDESVLHRLERVILLACDVGIIWPFAHMRIAFAQRLTLLADSVWDEFSYLSGMSAVGWGATWCWSEKPKRSMWCARSGLGIRQGHWGHLWIRLEVVRVSPHLDTRWSVWELWRRSLRQSGRVPRGYLTTTTLDTLNFTCLHFSINKHKISLKIPANLNLSNSWEDALTVTYNLQNYQ